MNLTFFVACSAARMRVNARKEWENLAYEIPEVGLTTEAFASLLVATAQDKLHQLPDCKHELCKMIHKSFSEYAGTKVAEMTTELALKASLLQNVHIDRMDAAANSYAPIANGLAEGTSLRVGVTTSAIRTWKAYATLVDNSISDSDVPAKLEAAANEIWKERIARVVVSGHASVCTWDSN